MNTQYRDKFILTNKIKLKNRRKKSKNKLKNKRCYKIKIQK